MYSSKPSVIYGFHGLDKEIALKILNQEEQFLHSNNRYDWLGQGVYFWENNLRRAERYAIQDSQRSDSKIKDPFVLGAVLELGNCLDLLDQASIEFVQEAYKVLEQDLKALGQPMPENQSFSPSDFDFKKRELDCAVIRQACELAEEYEQPFDSVRAPFIEGKEIYPGAKFHSENHIQIAVINPDCIKGIFLPRESGIEVEFTESK